MYSNPLDGLSAQFELTSAALIGGLTNVAVIAAGGGKNLGMKLGGRTLIYPTIGYEGHRQVSNFFNTLGHTAGQSLNLFGKEGPMRVAPGPLSDIWG